MKKFIKALLREGLVREVYGKNIIKSVATRFGVSENDEELLNKLAIASIYRNIFGDINKYQTKDSFDAVYDKWYENTINELIKTSAFVSNKELATKYLDAYVSNIKSVSGDVQPFSMKKIEQGLVDLVNNSGWIKDNGIGDTHSIYKPKSEDIVYEDDNIIILNTDTKAKCVMYGKGERWCITKPELNYYNTYRLNYGATPYFVLQKKNKDSDVEHKLVIMNYGNRGYAIADRSNSGKRHGGIDLAMPWANVESQIPNLRGKEKYFPYRAVTEDEKEYNTLLNNLKKSDIDDLQGLIDDKIKGLVINGSQVTAEDFIRDYAATGVIIPIEQLASLRDSLKDSLIESGYFIRLNKESFMEIKDYLSNKQILRNIRLKLNNDYYLTVFEITVLLDNNPNEEVKLEVVKQNGNAIYYIENPSEQLQLAAVNQYGDAIDFIIKRGITPSEDVKLAAVKRNGNAIQYIKNPSEQVQLAAVNKYGDAIDFIIKRGITPSERVKLLAVKRNGKVIRFIDNPSEQVQLLAVNQYGDTIRYINNPSEDVKLAAVNKYGDAIQYINNPSEQVQLLAVKQDGYAIRFIDNPSEQVQLAAVNKNGDAIDYIKNPSERVKLAAVKRNGNTIQFMDNPSEQVQLLAVKQNGEAIVYINNPSEQVQLAAVNKYGYAIEYIKNPSEQVQLAAVKQNDYAIRYIKNPSERVKVLYKELLGN